MDTIRATVTKISLKSLLTKATITAITADRVTLVVLNTMAKMQLDKKDNREAIEKICTDTLGRPILVDIVQMTPEELMQYELMTDL